LSFCRSNFHYNQKKSRCKMDDKFDGIVYSLWGIVYLFRFCNVPIKFPRSQCVPNSITLISIYGRQLFVCLFVLCFVLRFSKQTMVPLVVLYIPLESARWVQVHYVGFCKMIWKKIWSSCAKDIEFWVIFVIENSIN
jgi:hypothetical protein